MTKTMNAMLLGAITIVVIVMSYAEIFAAGKPGENTSSLVKFLFSFVLPVVTAVGVAIGTSKK